MTTAISCPEMDRLREFVQERLPLEEAVPLRQHLEECETCRAAAAQLSEEVAQRETPPPQGATMIRPEGVPPTTTAPARSKSAYLSPPERDDEIGRLAHYRILKVLGEGGMGIVFKAEDLSLERVVALKVMKSRADMEDDFEQRFFREARATAALRSDHIVTIFEINKDRNVYFLAMEFLQGESLENWLARGQRPSVTHTIRIAREIALGLGAAHAKGLIHRDIKPANIWLEQFPVSQPGAPPYRIKILDFGLARKDKDDQHLTQAGYIVGTPAYMAPEQAHGEPVDQRCDLFSLGCVLYHLCGGAQPFTGKTSMAVLAALVSMTPRPLDQVNPNLPKPLIDLVGRLMSKDPAGRPATAQAVVEELNAIEKNYKAQGGASSVRAPVERKPDKKDLNSLGLDDVGLAPLDEPPPPPKKEEKSAPVVKAPTPPPRPAVKSPTPPPRPAVMQTTIKKKGPKSEVRPGRELEELEEVEEIEEVSTRGKDSKKREAFPKRKGAEKDEKPEKKKKKKQGTPPWVWYAIGGGAAAMLLILVIILASGGEKNPTPNPGDPNTGGANQPPNPSLSAEEAWLKQTSSLSADQQMEAVQEELKKRNPGFDGKLTPKKTGALNTSLTFFSDKVTDLFPLRAVPTLMELDISGSKAGASSLANLSPLSSLKLTSFKANFTKVVDLSPLKAMPLQTLHLRQTAINSLEALRDLKLINLDVAITLVSDLSPLRGMPLQSVVARQTNVATLEPLRDMKLTTLDVSMTKVNDLSPLQNAPLKILTLQQTGVTNLKPLEGKPLTRVVLTGTKVTDLTPLLKSPIDNLSLSWQTAKEVEPLKALKTLKTVNNKPVDQFWKEVAMKK